MLKKTTNCYNKFEFNLRKIDEEINKVMNSNRLEIFNAALQKKLQIALENYKEQLDTDYAWLNNFPPDMIVRVVKKIQREDKKKLITDNLNVGDDE